MEMTETSGLMSAIGTALFFYLAILIFFIITMWKIFEKAGKSGWASIVPIYNVIIMLEIAKKPLWYIFLYFIPIVNIIFAIIVIDAFAKNFGKSTGFTLGLIFLGFIFFPILAFGDAQYKPVN